MAPQDFTQAFADVFAKITAAGTQPVLSSIPFTEIQRNGSGWNYQTKLRQLPIIEHGVASICDLTSVTNVLEKYAPGCTKNMWCMGNGVPLTSANVVQWLLQEAWDRWGKISLDASQANELINPLFNFLQNPKLSYSLVAPLVNASIATSGSNFSLGDVTIRPLMDDEVTKIYNFNQHIIGGASGHILIGYGATRKITIGCSFGECRQTTDMMEIVRTFQSVELAFRISKPGKVGIAGIYFIKEGFPNWGPRLSCGHPDYFIPWEACSFDEKDIRAVIDAWDKLQKNPDDTIKSAIERLSLAEIRMDDRDKLLDATIGLEALLLHEGRDDPYRGELGFRFALHYALLNGRKADSKQRFETAKRIYNARSKVAHGASLKNSSNLKNNSRDACSMLRETIYHFLSSGWPPQWKDAIFQ